MKENGNNLHANKDSLNINFKREPDILGTQTQSNLRFSLDSITCEECIAAELCERSKLGHTITQTCVYEQ